MRALRVAPLLTGILLLQSVLLTYGFGAAGAHANTVTLLIFGTAFCVALASGVYESPRPALAALGVRPALREHADPSAGNHAAIDWDAFDRARAMWQPGDLV